MLSRVKPAVGQSNVTINDKKNSKIPKLETFIEQRDYVGALTLLEVWLKLERKKYIYILYNILFI